MTTYPHWINEEVINQKSIDLFGYFIRSSVVYASDDMVLCSVGGVRYFTSADDRMDLAKRSLVIGITSDTFRFCEKAIEDSSTPSVMISLFGVTAENPIKDAFWSDIFVSTKWSTMLLIFEVNQKNLNLVEFLSETIPVCTDYYKHCFDKNHLLSDATPETEMRYGVDQYNKGLGEENVMWAPKRLTRITFPEGLIAGICDSVSK